MTIVRVVTQGRFGAGAIALALCAALAPVGYTLWRYSRPAPRANEAAWVVAKSPAAAEEPPRRLPEVETEPADVVRLPPLTEEDQIFASAPIRQESPEPPLPTLVAPELPAATSPAVEPQHVDEPVRILPEEAPPAAADLTPPEAAPRRSGFLPQELVAADEPAIPTEQLPAPMEPPAVERPRETMPATPVQTPNLDVPAVGDPWWNARLREPLRGASAKPMKLADLLTASLFHSEYVRAISLTPQIVETDIVRAQADFDSTAFLDTKWQQLNDPVGSTLTTGGPPRFLNDNMENRLGMRRKNTYGGTVEFAQEAGLQNTNTVFFQPANQSLTRMVLTYNQPLLRGAGQCYNESIIVLAEVDTRAAGQDVQKQLQEHVLKVIEAYWDLCLERSWYLQRVRARDKVLHIQRELEARREIDAVDSQILRARAAVAARTAALARAEAGIANAETRLRTLTNAPELMADKRVEVLPVETPSHHLIQPDLPQELQTALSSRPEIEAMLARIRGAEVRQGMAENELRPTLNLLLEGYVKGLKGNYDMPSSLAAQFGEGAPSYTTGLVYSAPIGNRAAQAKMRRRNLELQQMMHEFQNSLQTISGEVEIAAREVEATYREMLGNFQAVTATNAEVDFLLQRWRHLPGHDRNASLMLEDALNAQDRLVAVEATLAQSQRDFAYSLAVLKRADGTLLQTQLVRKPRDIPGSGVPGGGVPGIHTSAAGMLPSQVAQPPVLRPVLTRLPSVEQELR